MVIGPEHAGEYARRHQPIWPELATTLKAHGVHNYSIVRHPETMQLFAYLEIEDEVRWEGVGRTEVGQRWRRYMSEIMPANADLSPVTTTLSEVFHLD
jgi:L-rhamnose mutarotase